MEKQLKPIKLRTINGDEAWMYIDPKSIEVYISKKGTQTLSARITLNKLKKLTIN